MNQFNIIKINIIFRQDANPIHRLQTRRHWNISIGIKQGKKFHGLKVLNSYKVCPFIMWNYVTNQYQKIFKNNIF